MLGWGAALRGFRASVDLEQLLALEKGQTMQCFIELNWLKSFTLNSWKINRYLTEYYELWNQRYIVYMHGKDDCLSFDGEFVSKTSYS